MSRWIRVTAFWIALAAAPAPAQEPPRRGIVVDQTGLPLPGVTITVRDGDAPVATMTTAADGSFEAPAGRATSMTASLDGFETVTVAVAPVVRIVLPLAHVTDTTTVVAQPFALESESPTTGRLGTLLTAETVGRMPSSRLKAKESLPLLPSVVRGNDGLLRVGGARPYETPLLVDGFNVSDPATGISNINLPYEVVRGAEALRDPMAVTFGGLVGGVLQLETQAGGDRFKAGVQGFIPRPRFQNPGFGRLEGIFPRAFAGGSAANGRVRYLGSVEYDYEHIPVPDVTQGAGPDVLEQSATMFGRLDVAVSARHALTLEGIAFPASTESVGLSPRRDEPATTDSRSVDVFAGVTDRLGVGSASSLTFKFGVLSHQRTLMPNGAGAAYLSPEGWRGNWFASVDHRAVRYTAAANWAHTIDRWHGTHAVEVGGSVALRRLTGSVSETPVIVEDAAGRLTRRIEFDAAGAIDVGDRPTSAWARDVWQPHQRVQLDAGLRIDGNTAADAIVPSARAGVRYQLDRAGLTMLKAGVGRFVGALPLAVEAFAAYPRRLDRSFDPVTGIAMRSVSLTPSVDQLRLPRATTASVQVERQLAPSLDIQVGATIRRSDRLATLRVPDASGFLMVQSAGAAEYRELQVSGRRTWKDNQQLFVSYVRSSARGELNDFLSVFQALDAPILRPGGMARTTTDARNRWIAWGTFNLPRRSVVSPVVEIRSGFPYSAFDHRYSYEGAPNSREYPAFAALDLIAYKTFTVKKRSADLGVQLFNATNHFNPRDVYPVVGTLRYGEFANSVGTIVRGFMLVKW
jgi:hypothetical protein